METGNKITVETSIRSHIEDVWIYYTSAAHITGWNFASEDWHSPRAENDLRPGGRFSWRMEAKDGSMGFDFSGTYSEIKLLKKIDYVIDDGRKVSVRFRKKGDTSGVTVTFETEKSHPEELQRQGWQAILNNFRFYAENHIRKQ
jgi:uncharacterized protein YndB with AHSA1/START domain